MLTTKWMVQIQNQCQSCCGNVFPAIYSVFGTKGHIEKQRPVLPRQYLMPSIPVNRATGQRRSPLLVPLFPLPSSFSISYGNTKRCATLGSRRQSTRLLAWMAWIPRVSIFTNENVHGFSVVTRTMRTMSLLLLLMTKQPSPS
jgi:hypothetical protein